MNVKFFDKTFLTESLRRNINLCKIFIESNDMEAIACGSYPIDGENVFVNVFAYETQDEEERIWEAHRKYIDLHYIIQGSEKLYMSDISKMEQGVYDEAQDYIPITGEATMTLKMNQGDFCLCLTHDAHKTGVSSGQKASVKKAVFKIINKQ